MTVPGPVGIGRVALFPRSPNNAGQAMVSTPAPSNKARTRPQLISDVLFLKRPSPRLSTELISPSRSIENSSTSALTNNLSVQSLELIAARAASQDTLPPSR